MRSRLPAARSGKQLTVAHAALVGVVVAALAVVVRIGAINRGGGLDALANFYDDGVYYAAAAATSFGRMPYRDFVLLHPPGIVWSLLPFAWLGRLTHDSTGLAAARVAWAVLGGLSAALVVVVTRRFGLVAALAAGALYAVWPPAVNAETAPMLEPLGTLGLLTALALLSLSRTRGSARLQVTAGLALGTLPAVKIWGVVPLAVVLGYVAVVLGGRALVRTASGAVAAAAAICLPAFVAAPSAMWRMVVLDQLGRGHSTETVAERLQRAAAVDAFAGLQFGDLARPVAAGWIALAVTAVLALLALRTAQGRLYVALAVALAGLLVVSPSFFGHYTSLTAPAIALVVAAALGTVSVAGARPFVAAGAAAALLATAVAAGTVRPGRTFPAAALRPAVASARCVTADDPEALAALDVLSRDLRNGCRVEVDVTGATYDRDAMPLRPDGTAVPREENALWKRDLFGYLRSGDATMFLRAGADGVTAEDRTTIHRWRVLADRGGYHIYAPGAPR